MKKMNIIYIMCDDMGSWAMGCANNKHIITPNIDRMAENGVMFNNFFCTSPVCSPARASVVTGTMPSSHGVHDWIAKGNMDTEKYPNMKNHSRYKNKDIGIDYLKGQKTYIEHLYENGYTCALSGKWHLGAQDEMKAGFDKWFTIGGGGCDYFDADTFEHGNFSADTDYITDLITQKTLDYIQCFKNSEKPFYISVHYTAPHSPWDESNHPKTLLDLYRNCDFDDVPNMPVHEDQIHSAPIGDTEEKRRENLRGYYASITAVDTGVGYIIDALKKNGQYENTLIMFTSDNGMNMGHHGVWGKGNGTYPPNMYDSSIKIPLVVSSPLQANAVVSETYLTQCDIFPTIMELAGIDYEPTEKQPGISFLKELKGEKIEKTNDEIVIFDEYGIVRMIRTDKYKFIKNYKTGLCQFYDMVNDVDENNNLIDDTSKQNIIDELRTKMENWFTKYEREEYSGIRYDVRGRGQYDYCYNEKSFSDTISYYHKHRHADNVNPNNDL